MVKIERPDTGDDGRAWGPPFWNGEGAMFLSVNAGKRSLALSLRSEQGREVLLRLAERSDVFLQGLRPGLAERLGLGASAVRGRNPSLVYCSIGAYGRVGPLSDEPGYDALMQAAGGLMSMTGEPGGAGARVGSSLIDMGTGMWAALGIVAALLERERTGSGAEVDTSLYETALGYIGYHLVGFLADGSVPKPEGTVFPMVAPYQVFPTKDGELMVAGGNDRLFAALCAALELPELTGDPRFRTNPDRVAQPRAARRDPLRATARTRAPPNGSSCFPARASRPPRSRTWRTSPPPSRRERSGSSSRLEHPSNPGSPARGPPALLRRRARAASPSAAAPGRALGGGAAGGRLRRRGDRVARRGRRHSYAIALSGSSFAALRAGKTAATMPTTIAAITKMTTCSVGNENTRKSTR